MSTPTADKVTAVIDELFGLPADALTPDTTLHGGLQLDSLSVVELQVAIEDAFDIRFAEEESGGVETYGQLVDAVQLAVDHQRAAS